MIIHTIILVLYFFQIYTQDALEWDTVKEFESFCQNNSHIATYDIPKKRALCESPLCLAIANGRTNFVKNYISQHSSDDLKKSYIPWGKPMGLAIKYNQLDIIKLLIEYDSSIAQDCVLPNSISTALEFAVYLHRFQVINLLLDYNLVFCKNLTFFYKNRENKPVSYDSFPICRKLLLYGLTLTDLKLYIERLFSSPLHRLACTWFALQLHSAAQDFPHLVQQADVEGNTPLFYAATQMNKHMVDELLKAQSGVLTRNHDRKNIFYYLQKILKHEYLTPAQKDTYHMIYNTLHHELCQRYHTVLQLQTSGVTRPALPKDICKYLLAFC